MKMWRAGLGYIEAVEVERISATNVWIRGKRIARQNSFRVFHETWEAAHEDILERAKVRLLWMEHNLRAKVRLLWMEHNLSLARAWLETVKAMSAPHPKPGPENQPART